MIAKLKEKEKAIILRKRGFSYTEILRKIPVAKSTLSLWLRSIGLSKKQRQRLTDKKLASMKRGWEAVHQKKIRITNEIKNKAKNEIGKLSNREIWLIGTALYWAEGHKEKWRGTNIKFSNSDPQMIKLFLRWAQEICKISKENIFFEIYLHKAALKRETEVKDYWSKITNFSLIQFRKIRWKKNKLNTKRKNIGRDYYGLVRVNLKRSTNLNRKVSGWIEGIIQNAI